jgi:Beta-fructosidases (levanase/invertase)
MRWRKLGKVFDPRDVTLPAGCCEFAQSPQVIGFHDFLRVYFSTRSIDDATGKYRSHVACVDTDRSLRHVLRVAAVEPLPLGGLGCFDEHGIFPMSVVRHGDEILAYTTGWSRRVSVSVETAIGLAVSRDGGITFERTGPGPVMGASPHEPFLVGDGFVRVVGGTFHMWHIFGTEWRRAAPGAEPERTYKIGHAVSQDGVSWTREEGRPIVADRLGSDESQALPTVIEIDGRHHMFFCYRESVDFRTAPGRGYRIGHAVSEDLRTWTRDESDALPSGEPGEWDADMQCYPHVFACDGRIYMLYNGNEFGRFGFGAAVLER